MIPEGKLLTHLLYLGWCAERNELNLGLVFGERGMRNDLPSVVLFYPSVIIVFLLTVGKEEVYLSCSACLAITPVKCIPLAVRTINGS